MTDPVFTPQLRKAPRRKKAPAATKRSVERIGRQELIARRDFCIMAITRHDRDESNHNAFFSKARTLLTRHWYPSSWRSRADILRNAEWLLRVGEQLTRAETLDVYHLAPVPPHHHRDR
jgi:hypothetical protein